MKYSVLFFLILFTACSNKDNLSELQKKVSENESDATDKQKMLIENLRITYNDPIEPKNYSTTIIPILLEEKYYEKGISNSNYSNILFYNHKTKENNFLFKDSIDIITSLNYFEKPIKDKKPEDDYGERVVRYGNYGSAAYSHIFYEIKPWKTKKELKEISKETSHSYGRMKSSYQETGPSVLYISDFEGNQLTALTPPNGRLLSWRILQNSNVILAEVLLDSNNDLIYNKKDDKQLLRIDLEEAKIGEAVLSKEEEITIKTNLLKGKEGNSN